MKFIRGYWSLGLNFHKLLEIFQKFPIISQKVSQKLLFVTKVAKKLLEKMKTFFGLMLKIICKIYNKRKISKHVCTILQRSQHCQKTLSSIKTKKSHEPIKLFSE